MLSHSLSNQTQIRGGASTVRWGWKARRGLGWLTSSHRGISLLFDSSRSPPAFCLANGLGLHEFLRSGAALNSTPTSQSTIFATFWPDDFAALTKPLLSNSSRDPACDFLLTPSLNREVHRHTSTADVLQHLNAHRLNASQTSGGHDSLISHLLPFHTNSCSQQLVKMPCHDAILQPRTPTSASVRLRSSNESMSSWPTLPNGQCVCPAAMSAERSPRLRPTASTAKMTPYASINPI